MGRVGAFFGRISDKYGLFWQAVMGILVSGAASILLPHVQEYVNDYVFGGKKDVGLWWGGVWIATICSAIVIGLGLWGILAIQARERRNDRKERQKETKRILDAIH